MPINNDTIDTAYDEAIRFCSKVEKWRALPEGSWERTTGGIHSAAIKRSSMDLTRALADLRRSGG